MQIENLTQEQLDGLLKEIQLLKQENANLHLQVKELTTDLTVIKKACFALLEAFHILDANGDPVQKKPSVITLGKTITKMIMEAYDGKEDTLLNRIYQPLVPFATKYKHLK